MKHGLMKSHQTVLQQTVDQILSYLFNKWCSTSMSFEDYVHQMVSSKQLTDDELNNAYIICAIKIFGREVDLFAVLPQREMFVHIEVKDTESTRGHAAKAKKQLSQMKEWMQDVHGHIFPPGWRYVSVTAFPSVSGSTQNPFEMYKETFEKGLEHWWNALLFKCNATTLNAMKDKSYNAYVKFVKNSIACTQLEHDFRIGPQSSAKKVQEALIGKGASAVTSGANLNDDAPLENLLKWTPEQEALRRNKTKKLIISKDYGVGELIAFTTFVETKYPSMYLPK